MFTPEKLFAHAPFDCNSRAIVHGDFLEVTVTVGSTLGETFLKEAGVNLSQLSQGHPFSLNSAFGTNFFGIVREDVELAPREADVITDGLEFQFHFEYSLSPAKSLELTPKFLPALKSRNVPLVLTDETGNILGSAVLSEEKRAAKFQLPERIFPKAGLEPQKQAPTVAPNDSPSATPAAPELVAKKPSPSFAEFLKLGVEHILTGFDHLLFLLALLLGCRELKAMLWVVTGFTLAHSLTLALAALNVVSLSPRIIEPAIAASILFVAAENFRQKEKSWQRYTLTCGFGLVHGFGFAGALRSSGLADDAGLIKPLLAFNLGVEIGQLAVAAIVLPLLLYLQRRPMFQRFGIQIVSGLIMLIAAWWLILRIISSGE